MRQLAEGRLEALAVLVRRHQGRTLSLAYRFLGRWEDAEDVCQEAFVRTLEAAPAYKPTARYTTWLYRVVANLCWDRRRKAAREPGELPAEMGHLSTTEAPVDLEQDEKRAQVRRAVAGLPDRQRLVLILHRYAGLTHKEIVEATGWSTGAVESCLVRAYRQLRTSLADLKEA